METVNVTVRMKRQTRDDAAKLFSELGISTTQAINMFLKQAVREQRIPFEVAARPAVDHRAARLEEPNRGSIIFRGKVSHVERSENRPGAHRIVAL